MLDIILTHEQGFWFWRIDRWETAATIECCMKQYASPEAALADAKARWNALKLAA